MPDLYDMLPAVDILAALEKARFEEAMQKPKWSERAGALQAALDALGPQPKAKAGNYSALVGLLMHHIKKDNNNQVHSFPSFSSLLLCLALHCITSTFQN